MERTALHSLGVWPAMAQFQVFALGQNLEEMILVEPGLEVFEKMALWRTPEDHLDSCFAFFVPCPGRMASSAVVHWTASDYSLDLALRCILVNLAGTRGGLLVHYCSALEADIVDSSSYRSQLT